MLPKQSWAMNCQVSCCYLEIYNEDIRDLLQPGGLWIHPRWKFSDVLREKPLLSPQKPLSFGRTSGRAGHSHPWRCCWWYQGFWYPCGNLWHRRRDVSMFEWWLGAKNHWSDPDEWAKFQVGRLVEEGGVCGKGWMDRYNNDMVNFYFDTHIIFFQIQHSNKWQQRHLLALKSSQK